MPVASDNFTFFPERVRDCLPDPLFPGLAWVVSDAPTLEGFFKALFGGVEPCGGWEGETTAGSPLGPKQLDRLCCLVGMLLYQLPIAKIAACQALYAGRGGVL